jgi:hypothetical protein
MKLFLDIETIPALDAHRMLMFRRAEEEEKNAITAGANFKKPESIANEIERKRAAFDASAGERYAKLALDPVMLTVVCIGYAAENGEVRQIMSPSHDERDLLIRFYSVLRSFRREFTNGKIEGIVGHNVRDFDLPALRFAYARHELPVPEMLRLNEFTGRENVPVYDTMKATAGYGKYIKQAKLAELLQIPDTGDETTGADVFKEWTAGDYQSIAKHCAADVHTVREIYERLNIVYSPAVNEENEDFITA